MESDLQMEYESVLCLKNKDGKLVAFYRNDIKNRAVKLYGTQELSLDEIKNLFSKASAHDNPNETTEQK